MPALVHYIKDVTAGFGDYFTDTHTLSENDQYIDMEFNAQFTMEDFLLESAAPLVSGDTLQVSLVYPQSKRSGLITTIQAAGSGTLSLQYFLNSTNQNTSVVTTGHLGTGKQWYRIDPRTLLRVQVTNLVSGSIQIRFNAIGCSGHTG